MLEEVAHGDCRVSVLGDIQTPHGQSTKQGDLVDPTHTTRVVCKGRTADIFRGLIENIQRFFQVQMILSFCDDVTFKNYIFHALFTNFEA